MHEPKPMVILRQRLKLNTILGRIQMKRRSKTIEELALITLAKDEEKAGEKKKSDVNIFPYLKIGPGFVLAPMVRMQQKPQQKQPQFIHSPN
ncbi:hypothetical protein CHS0354_037487 [Potamilus streckersoni]|uniref:Uncharacterized protein n=1 Tax=Potamilus streckersoni TaxID=2493646 RepID=A0AAE0RPA0_9BIVA|nr:hypothetical protein CHS0354_037487 [Potamilus streckersoni]